MLVPEGHATTKTKLIWVACTVIQGHCIFWVLAAAKGHVCVCDPTIAAKV